MADPVALVTGAAGALGRAVTASLARAGYQVSAAGRGEFPAGAAAWHPGALDRAGIEAAARAFGVAPAVVVHCAGPGRVGPSVGAPHADFEAQVGVLALLLDVLRMAAPAARLIFPSSAAVYGSAGGEEQPTPLGLDTPTLPASPYGWHKLCAELLLRGTAALERRPVAILRFFSLYGAGHRKLLLWDVAQRLRAGETPLLLDGTGAECRDYLHIDDAARLVLACAQAPVWPTRVPLLLNAGTGIATPIAAVAAGLRDHLAPGVPIGFTGRTRPGDPRHYVADPSDLAAFGFRPRIAISDGVPDFARWVIEAAGAARPARRSA